MARCRVEGLTSFRSTVLAAAPALPKFAACFTLSTHLCLQQKAELMMSIDLGLAAPGRLTAWARMKGKEIKERGVPALGDFQSGEVTSQTRDRTRVPCTGRQILNHWTTREPPSRLSLYSSLCPDTSHFRKFDIIILAQCSPCKVSLLVYLQEEPALHNTRTAQSKFALGALPLLIT